MFQVRLSVCVSVIFLGISVAFCHNCSKTLMNACKSGLQFVQRQTSSCSTMDLLIVGVIKNRISSSSLITIRGNRFNAESRFLPSKFILAFATCLTRVLTAFAFSLDTPVRKRN